MATSQAMTIATGSSSEIEEVRGRWRTDEDEKLIRAVKERGAKNWSVICTQIPGRSAKSCRLRWQNQLSPDVNHSPFTLEEDLEIVRHQSRLGNKWAAIARVLNAGRTENAVKNHWNCKIRKMMRSYSPPYDRRRAYHRYGCYRYHPRPLPSPPAFNGSVLVLRSLYRRVISFERSSHRFFPSNGGGEPHGSIDLTLRLAPPAGPVLRSSSLPSTREMVSFVARNEARGHLVELRGNLQIGSNHAYESVMNLMENQAAVGRMN